MTNVKIQIKQINAKIDCREQIEKACIKCAFEIKKNADALFYENRNNHVYSRGWTYKIHERKDPDFRYGEVFNKVQPQLSHLLEFGHMTRYSTGKYGQMRTWEPPKKHITPAFNSTKNDYLKDCKNVKITWKTEKG